jgi:transposase
MSIHPQPIEAIPDDTYHVARAAFPKGNNSIMLIRDHMPELFKDEDFVEMYHHLGQPAYSPWRLALVSVFQFLENLTDRQAADAVRGRIDWKYALSLPLLGPTAAPTGLGRLMIQDSTLQSSLNFAKGWWNAITRILSSMVY